jgi:hypothetical protein
MFSARVKFNTLDAVLRHRLPASIPLPGHLMADERLEVPMSDLLRWLVIFGLVVLGIVLYMVLAPKTEPVVHPASQELAP